VFPEVFSVSDSGSKSMEGGSKPGVGWGLTSGESFDDRCMFIKYRGESCIVCNQETAK